MVNQDCSSLLPLVASELESLRDVPKHDGLSFPPACRSLLFSLPGNKYCVDCGNAKPEWASVTYGTLLCVQCSGVHRSYGVATSRVRSVFMDAWSHEQVLKMLEGGNDQLQLFFNRHKLGNDDEFNALHCRYETKAALFYRTHLQKHVETVAQRGLYQGRHESRRQQKQSKANQQQKCNSIAEARQPTNATSSSSSSSSSTTEARPAKRRCSLVKNVRQAATSSTRREVAVQ